MMNHQVGMEIQAVRRFARTLDERAAEIERVIGAANARVDSVSWRGNDRDRFVRDWHDVHEGRLRRAAAGMRDAAGAARAKAAEQERVSRSH